NGSLAVRCTVNVVPAFPAGGSMVTAFNVGATPSEPTPATQRFDCLLQIFSLGHSRLSVHRMIALSGMLGSNKHPDPMTPIAPIAPTAPTKTASPQTRARAEKKDMREE